MGSALGFDFCACVPQEFSCIPPITDIQLTQDQLLQRQTFPAALQGMCIINHMPVHAWIWFWILYAVLLDTDLPRFLSTLCKNQLYKF